MLIANVHKQWLIITVITHLLPVLPVAPLSVPTP